MNKIAIPALLVATIMVAGMFAFIPVEKASTVHTTIVNVTINNLDFGISAFLDVAANADVGDIAQNVADTFGATDDDVFVGTELSIQGQITVTQAATDTGACNISVTVVDSDSGEVLINDVQIITGADLNDVGTFSLTAPTDMLFESIDVSVATDGAAADDCDFVGLDFDLRGRDYS